MDYSKKMQGYKERKANKAKKEEKWYGMTKKGSRKANSDGEKKQQREREKSAAARQWEKSVNK